MDNYFYSDFNEEFSLEILRIMSIEIPIIKLVIENTEILILILYINSYKELFSYCPFHPNMCLKVNR